MDLCVNSQLLQKEAALLWGDQCTDLQGKQLWHEDSSSCYIHLAEYISRIPLDLEPI